MTATVEELLAQLEEVQARLAGFEETLRAIRHGEVDALLVGQDAGMQKLLTVGTADRTYRSFVEGMTDGAATVSTDGIVLFANQALATLVGSTCPVIVGQPVAELITDGSRGRLDSVIGAEHAASSVEATLLSTTGVHVPVLLGASGVDTDDGHVICLTFTDLTGERAAEANLTHLAQHDALTDLTNRTLLIDRVQHALERHGPERGLMVLLFCDVDGFKNINDAYGHQVGDAVLIATAARLTSVVRPQDTVARIGGDEFVVFCESVSDMEQAALTAARIQSAVSAPLMIGDVDVDVTVSIGVAVAGSDDDANPDTLLRDADEAMYQAKRQGPNVIEMFDEKLRIVAAARIVLLTDLRRASTGQELQLVYQPVVRIDDEKVVGAEALLRWEHPTRGLISPAEFIPFAERSGLIVPIGAWVMHQACLQGAEWERAEHGGSPMNLAVNVSGRQLGQGTGFVDLVKEALAESGLTPTSLTIEVTESALIDDAESALRVLHELKALGVRIAIDDFGTGYSSLIYLKRFPVDVLKVDRSFVEGLGQNTNDNAIVRSVIDLAQAFDMETVAEGIETVEQLDVLRSLGCRLGQGFLWSPGRSAETLGQVLSESA
jgi:diguanylate cyclase (GGDEF)-like protein/PAS domain S-box-containing protein